MGKSEHTMKLMLCDIVCIMYVYLSKTYSCLVLDTSRPKEEKSERESSSYIECSWRVKRGEKKIQEEVEKKLSRANLFALHH